MVAEATAPPSAASAGALPWWPFAGQVVYLLLVATVLLAPLVPPDRRLELWIWSTAPAHATTIGCAVFTVWRGRLSPQRRLAWAFVLAALVLSFIGTALWAWDWTRAPELAAHTGDIVYLLAYPSFGMLGLFCFLRDLGGPVRRFGVLLDALALALGLGAALWCFVVVPSTPAGADAMSVLDTVVRSALLILPAVSAGVVYTHVSDWTVERGLGCLLVAAVLSLCGDMLWAGRAVPDRLDQASVYSLIYLGANIAATLAMSLDTRRQPRPATRNRTMPYSLMPALIILGCLIALVATGTPLAAQPQRIALAMLIAATLVLAVREALAQHELRQLERERSAARALLDHEASDRAQLFERVHEGVAQELAGLRLSMSATSRDPALAAESLRTAIEQLGQTISNTREIASRLAPLQSARGSLRLALEALQVEAATSGLPCQLESGDLDCECPPATAELVHRIVRHVIESARTDASLQSLGIRITPGDEALAVHVHARSSASTGPVLDHPGWSPLNDRLHVVGGQATGAVASDGWWFTVRVPLCVVDAQAG